MGILNSRDEHVYIQVAHPYVGEVPNSTGTATLANTDIVQHIRMQLNRQDNVIRSAGKTGALGILPGIKGRRGATWSAEFPFRLSGTAGTAPDLDPILEAIFGAAGTDTPATSVAYALTDNISELTLWSFLTPAATHTPQRCLWGGVLDEFELSSGDGEPVLRCSGSGAYVIDKPNFSNFSTAEKGGLSAFPSEPASGAFTGQIVPAFTGSVTLNSVGTFKVESWSIRGRFNRSARYAYGSYLATVPIAGVREISMNVRLYLENIANVSTFRELAHSKSTFDGSLVMGDTAGYIATFALNNITLNSENFDDSNPEWTIGWQDNLASMTDASTKDELTLTLT